MENREIKDPGPWQVGMWHNPNRVVIQSDYFEFDVALIVDGDFRDLEEKVLYAEMLADKLNRSKDV